MRFSQKTSRVLDATTYRTRENRSQAVFRSSKGSGDFFPINLIFLYRKKYSCMWELWQKEVWIFQLKILFAWQVTLCIQNSFKFSSFCCQSQSRLWKDVLFYSKKLQILSKLVLLLFHIMPKSWFDGNLCSPILLILYLKCVWKYLMLLHEILISKSYYLSCRSTVRSMTTMYINSNLSFFHITVVCDWIHFCQGFEKLSVCMFAWLWEVLKNQCWESSLYKVWFSSTCYENNKGLFNLTLPNPYY